MSITDELREYFGKSKGMFTDHVLAIADRIDAEHEEQLNDAFETRNSDENLESDGWVRLPKDADGVPIRIGDVMESKGSGLLFGETSFEVRSMRCDECGWEVYDRLGDRYHPSSLRHHHAPTVEDVLREFTDAILEWSGKSGTVAEVGTWSDVAAEYAAKLRLAETEDA